MIGSTKLKDLNKDFSIHVKDNWYSVCTETNLVGVAKVKQETYNNQVYNSIDVIYVLPEYRSTPARKWLLYSLKEESNYPIIADGAIFASGQKIIDFISKNKLFRIKVLDKVTGNISDYCTFLNEPDLCYLFEQTKLGYFKQLFESDTALVIWFDFF